MDELNKIVSENLIKFRNQAGLTQLALAEKIQYSDKSISKWERGESLPDLAVLTKLANIYGISLNDFVSNGDVKVRRNNLDIKSILLITLLSVGLVWFVACATFFGLYVAKINFPVWLIFIYAIPISGIVLEVFSAIWGNEYLNILSSSVILWGLIISICLSLSMKSLWLLCACGGVFEILIIFFFILLKHKKFEKKKKYIEK